MKRLVLCFDGTWNKPDQDKTDNIDEETNVRRIFTSVEENEHQMRWYDEGVGTKWYDKFLGGLFGLGLNKNIKEGYKFLIENYNEGDEIFLFGFSRGAYTARSLVGLIRKSGLLQKQYVNKINEAYSLYRTKESSPDSQDALAFRKKYSREIKVKFIGVWDTVGALGIPSEHLSWFNRKYFEFHDTGLSRIVEHAYHAIAVDEHRQTYNVTLWNSPKPNQILEQRWFPGAHSNVGGGYNKCQLSYISLYWMQKKAMELGIALKPSNFTEDYYKGAIVDSYGEFLKGAYKLKFPRYYRPIRKTQANEVLDDSVIKKRSIPVPPYDPQNPGIE